MKRIATYILLALPALPVPAFEAQYVSSPSNLKGTEYVNPIIHADYSDPDYGIFMVKTTDPEGQWSEPVLVKAGKGLIDPTPLWDNDGKAYLANAWAASRTGFNSIITLSEMTPDGASVTGNPRIIYDGNDGVNHTLEGPKLYRRGDYYYIFAPAGGVEQGWQLVMRSKNINGPYESKIVMAQGKSDIVCSCRNIHGARGQMDRSQDRILQHCSYGHRRTRLDRRDIRRSSTE